MKTISYALLTHNEGVYIEQVLKFLVEYKHENDEIVVVDDYSSDELSKAILEEYQDMGLIKLFKRELNNDFAEQKNYLTSLCTGDYIFQIDADELPTEYLINSLSEILESNPECEVYLVPRVNTVEGLTQEHIQKWGWNVNEKGWVNFPDYQWRIYKNDPKIKWINKVHEKLSGFTAHALFPAVEDFALYHFKDIERQEKQNDYYNTI
jgi:glycosyltransferase involved in cell wall biosynthesis